MTTPSKKPGRKHTPADLKLVVITVRVTPAQRAKWDRTPARAARFRDWLERLQEVKAAPIKEGEE